MKNGECPTWFVVKWLERHPKHTANAPHTVGKFEARVRQRGNSCLLFENRPEYEWDIDILPDQRSDWTIYDERGRKVKFKVKSELRKIGSVEPGQKLSVGKIDGWNISNNVVDVFVRERKR